MEQILGRTISSYIFFDTKEPGRSRRPRRS
jgi:hypothetical protein